MSLHGDTPYVGRPISFEHRLDRSPRGLGVAVGILDTAADNGDVEMEGGVGYDGHRDRRCLSRNAPSADLAGRAATETEREAVTNQIHAAGVALREARTQRTIDGVYARYMPDPTDDARRDRALTLAYDTLSDPPAWVVEHVRYLHDT